MEFAYAQSRLPSTDEEFAVSPRIRMLIKHKNHPDPDAVFPRADTCFFNVELPAYSSLELMRDRLTRVVSMDWGMSGDDHLELTEVSTFPPGHAITLVSSNASGAAPAEPSNDSSESRALRTRRIRRLDAVRSIRQPLLSPVQREDDPNASPDRVFPPENSEE